MGAGAPNPWQRLSRRCRVRLLWLLAAAVLVWPAVSPPLTAAEPVPPPAVEADAPVTPPADPAEDPDFGSPPFMVFFALLVMIVALILIGIGVVIGVVLVPLALAVVAAMAGMGMVSLATVVGLIVRRPRRGVQVFFVQIGAFGGAAAGAILGLVASYIEPLELSHAMGSTTGAIGGLVGGLLVALLFNTAWSGGLDVLVDLYRRWRAPKAA